MNVIAFLLLFAQVLAMNGVVTGGGANPLSKAKVELLEDDGRRVAATVTTGQDGRFSFANMRPGRYRIQVKRAGYVRAPIPVNLTATQPVPELHVAMMPAGAISGRVYSREGQPVPNVEVQAFKASYAGAYRVLTPLDSVQTNDLGEYRLFWLSPGRYYLRVRALSPEQRFFGQGSTTGNGFFFATRDTPDPAVIAAIDNEPDEEQFVPVYFPGTIDEREANPIDVRAGGDTSGMDVTFSPARAQHIRGVIVDSGGKPAPYASIRTEGGFEGVRRQEMRVNPENGTFDITLLAGPHLLIANAESGTAYLPIVVGNSAIENLTLVTTTPFNIRGRVAVENARVPVSDLQKLRITLRRDIAPQFAAQGPARSYSRPVDDGSFTVEAAVGDFRVNVAPLLNTPGVITEVSSPDSLPNLYVKSIRLGGRDVLNAPLQLDGPTQARLEIVLAGDPGSISGTVVTQTREAIGDVSVLLVPDIRQRIDLYKSVISDPAGRFTFDHLPPGMYKLFAWPGIDESWFDPDFVQAYETRGTPVSVLPGVNQSVEVIALPPQ